MANFYVDFNNQTTRTWTMSVYQTLPDSIGLDSVSWKQSTVPRNGEGGVMWEVSYNVALANYEQIGGKGVYKANQTLSAGLGSEWEIRFEDGVQQLFRTGSTTPGQILILNRSGTLASPGIGMAGQGSVYKREMLSGSDAQFKVVPTYWVGLFNSVVLGEVISSNVIVGPFKLQFEGGKERATINAVESQGSIRVDINYSQTQVIQTELLNKKIAAIEGGRL